MLTPWTRAFALALALLSAWPAAAASREKPRPNAPATDSQPAARVDALVKAEMEKRRVPGLSLAVVRDGKIAELVPYYFDTVPLVEAFTAEPRPA